ncbi:hypothetical protein PybrP1_012599 [[Pythium] brassicae (nom. inval.)]|nr:hypothetical protein PybrP1_012599 [[Pythium] brassicae (nom. inval.)]
MQRWSSALLAQLRTRAGTSSVTASNARLRLHAQQRRAFRNDSMYAAQDFGRQVEKRFSELSGKIPWEPDPVHLEGVKRQWESPEPNLNELVRQDIPLARNLFRNVLQQHYKADMGMWNKWGVMEWKAGNFDLARMIFAKAAKVSFHAELWQSWASMELAAKNHAEAKRLYKVILATDPSNPGAGLGLALLEAEIGDRQKARERFDQLAREHPDDVLILQAYAVFEASKGQHMALARDMFQATTRHPRATAQVWHAWAKAEFDNGFYKNCVTVVTRALRTFPTHKWLVLQSAMAYYKLENVYEARRAFRRLIDGGFFVEPSAYNAYARMEEDLGHDDAALALYLEVLSQHPDHIPSVMSLAMLHHKRGHLQNARRVFENALQNIHHSGELLMAWGDFEEKIGEFENARELFDEATKQQPTHVAAWRGLARVESRLGNIDAARAVLSMASQHSPHDAPLLVELGKIEQRRHNFVGARAAYEKALKLDPANAALWNMRALLELPLDAERAKNIVESALSTVPRHEKRSWSILMCTYGRAFAAMEDFEKAVAAFQNSFKLQPKNPETHMIYAECVLLPNEAHAEAKKHLLAARNLLPRTHKRRAVVETKLQAVEELLALGDTAAGAPTASDDDDDNSNNHDEDDADHGDEASEEQSQ